MTANEWLAADSSVVARLNPAPPRGGRATTLIAGHRLGKKMELQKIEAATVNHDTSRYMELMLRSLFGRHPRGLDLSLTVFDNASTDDMSELIAYTESRGIPIIQSGFATDTVNNSHGEILSRFVLDHPDCTHYLFLDPDVCFLEENTIGKMLYELDKSANTFGIGPRMSWDGVKEIPEDARNGNPDICDARLHPCCALVKNAPLFRDVVEEIGLSSVKYLWAEGGEIVDTFKLMTKVMKTHGLRHVISSTMVLHFFCVSYVWEPTKHWNEAKAKRRDELLYELRVQDAS
jgi:hypothetical protein